MALCQTRLTSVLLPFLDRPVCRLRTPRYTPSLFPPVTVCPSTRQRTGRSRERLFSPSNRTCDEAPVIVTKKPILSPIPRRIPNSQSRVTTLETRDAPRYPPFTDRKRYSIFRLAASRMLNTSYAVHVRIYIYIRTYIRFQREKKRIP